jgi:branched-chain amino acid transport system permease protein
MGFVNVVLQGILIGGLFALTATGLSLMFGVMRVVNLAYGDFSIAAAYLAFLFIDQLFVPVWLAVLVTVPLFGVVGYVLQRLLLNRSLAGGPLATLLVTFGLSVVVENVLQQLFSADTKTINIGALGTGSFQINASISISYLSLITMALAVALILGVQSFLSHTGLGRMMRASSDDPEIATVVGGDSRHIYAMATGIAFATVAIGGLLMSMRSSFSPTLGTSSLLFAFEAVVIGGLGSLWGTLAGGVLLGLTQSIAAYFDPSSAILAGHLVFLIVLAVRPQGLFPRRAI